MGDVLGAEGLQILGGSWRHAFLGVDFKVGQGKNCSKRPANSP
jgi:hypothetical protein